MFSLQADMAIVVLLSVHVQHVTISLQNTFPCLCSYSYMTCTHLETISEWVLCVYCDCYSTHYNNVLYIVVVCVCIIG